MFAGGLPESWEGSGVTEPFCEPDDSEEPEEPEEAEEPEEPDDSEEPEDSFEDWEPELCSC